MIFLLHSLPNSFLGLYVSLYTLGYFIPYSIKLHNTFPYELAQ
jgi:hypothetical protein